MTFERRSSRMHRAMTPASVLQVLLHGGRLGAGALDLASGMINDRAISNSRQDCAEQKGHACLAPTKLRDLKQRNQVRIHSRAQAHAHTHTRAAPSS
eukprot:119438-Alexandrium_andersonii.AAC.1